MLLVESNMRQLIDHYCALQHLTFFEVTSPYRACY